MRAPSTRGVAEKSVSSRHGRGRRRAGRAAASVGFVLAMGSVGCRCDDGATTSGATPATEGTPSQSQEEVAEPTVAAAVGFTCPAAAQPPNGPAPDGALARFGDVWVRAMPHWNAPPAAERFLHVAGVRDPAGDGSDGSVMLRHALPKGEYALLSVKPHDVPPDSDFGMSGARKVFDDVAASPAVALITVAPTRWAGHAAADGAVYARGSGERTVVHHLVVQLEGQHAVDVVYIAPESQYRRFLGDACASIGAVK